MSDAFLFLGTGASTGVPVIGCDCPVCQSSNPKNKRLRPSGLLTIGDQKLLIDTGPDFRLQALTHGITTLDGVLYTHTHFDHIAGLDELRTYYFHSNEPMKLFVSRSTYEDLQRRYYYLFNEKSGGVSLAAQVTFQIFEGDRGIAEFCGIPFRYVTYTQGGMDVSGFRFGRFAYISDIKEYPDTIFKDLQGVDCLVLSALSHKESPMHLTLDEAVAFAQKIGVKRCFFTHICHRLEHEEANQNLPEGYSLAFDGQRIEL